MKAIKTEFKSRLHAIGAETEWILANVPTLQVQFPKDDRVFVFLFQSSSIVFDEQIAWVNHLSLVGRYGEMKQWKDLNPDHDVRPVLVSTGLLPQCAVFPEFPTLQAVCDADNLWRLCQEKFPEVFGEAPEYVW